jgi:uncharacterized protein (TIGR03545 family)
MIRWKYAVPRLLLAATALLLLYFGLNPLVRWSLITLSEQALSTKVDIGCVNASLRNAELQIDYIAVANPRRPSTNLLEADQVKLSLETNALLRRKFVVEEGAVHGLRLHTDRREPAEPIDDWQWSVNGDKLTETSDKWLTVLSTSLGKHLEAEVESLESVRLAKVLLESWPEQYQQLEARVRDVKARVEAIRKLFRTQPNSIADGVQHYQKTLAELEQLQREMDDLAGQIDGLPDRIESDRDAILAATQRDIQTLEQRIESIRLDEETITAYFLGPETGRRVVAIAQWVQWVRSHLPDDEEEIDRPAGVNILFAGRRPRPDFLVESLHIDGETRIAGQPYSFVATAAGLTTQPQLYGRPAEITAELVGNFKVEVHALLDRTGDLPRDQIVFSCPDLTLPEISLGREDAVALVLRPGKTQVWIGLTLAGDQVLGSLLMRQSGVELTPTVAETFGGQRLADNFALATASLKEIEIQVDMAGPLARPKWGVRSNLGPNLAEGLNRAALAELEYRRNQAAHLVQNRVDKELNKFRNRLAMDEEILRSRLRLSETEIQQLGKLVARRIPSADQILTKALGDRLPLRF